MDVTSRVAARALAALMIRAQGPATLVGGEWVYGRALDDCARWVDDRCEGRTTHTMDREDSRAT